MSALLALPGWALLALAGISIAVGLAILNVVANELRFHAEIHEFKIRVITLRNDQIRRLEALYSGDDPDGEASDIFGADHGMMPDPLPLPTQPESTEPAAAAA